MPSAYIPCLGSLDSWKVSAAGNGHLCARPIDIAQITRRFERIYEERLAKGERKPYEKRKENSTGPAD